MCGIAGIARFDVEPSVLAPLIERMCSAIAHRGPDGRGQEIDRDVALGMTRLAIVDIEHGKQPMLSDDRQIVLVFNGEIYNAPALRKELESEGIRFHTRSDTEVILRLYERDPTSVEERLRGMWAFAIHDRRRKLLVLSRDRFGIKPLYVTTTGKGIAFASELGALRTLSDRSEIGNAFEIDRGSAHAMLSWSYIPNEASIHAGIRRLAPATRLVVDLQTGKRTTERYYEVKPFPGAAHVESVGDACALIEPVLASAVKEHLESDVPIASFMSGGIDSSLVTYYAVRASTRPIAGYGIGFREARFDESPFARETAAKIGVEITITYFDEDSARASLADALVAYDEPFGDSSSLATYMLSSVVSRNHKVALGGDGGDEIFAGYRKHRIVRLREALESAPSVRDTIGDALLRIPARTDRTSTFSELLRTTRRLAHGLSGNDAAAYLALTQIAPLARTARLVRTEAIATHFEAPILESFGRAGGGQLQRTLVSDLANVLPNDMLTKVDRASMACRLEARVPLLDHRLVEIGVGLPDDLTLGSLRGNQGKRVLRALHERHFGKKLARREKRGFGVPVERWLRGPLAPACERLFSKASLDRFGILDSNELGEGRWRAWKQRDPQILWNCFALAAWCEAVLGDGPNTLREIVSR